MFTVLILGYSYVLLNLGLLTLHCICFLENLIFYITIELPFYSVFVNLIRLILLLINFIQLYIIKTSIVFVNEL